MPRHNHIRAHKMAAREAQLGQFVEDVKGVLGLDEDDEPPRKQRTSTAIVYVTLEPTFTGEIAGYSTVSEPDETPVPKATQTPKPPTVTVDAEEAEEEPTPEPKPTKPATTLAQVTTKPAAPKSSAAADDDEEGKETSLLSSIKVSKTTSGSAEATAAIDVDDEITTTKAAGTPLSNTSNTSAASPAAAGVTDGGMSGGAKAGIAIGVILGLGLIAGLVFFLIRKKKSKGEDLDNEKTDNFGPGFIGAGAAVAGNRSEKPMANAPRLDVRPTTAFFMPNRASQMAKPSTGDGNLMNAQNNSPAKSGWDRPMNQDNNNAANPFGDAAATSPTTAVDPVNARGPSQMNGAGIALAAGVVGAAAGAAAANRSNSPANGQNGAVGAVIKGPVRSTSRGGATNRSPIQGSSPFSDAARTDGGAQGTAQLVQSGNAPQPLSGVIEEGGPLSPKSAGFPGSPLGPVIVGAATGAAIGAANGNELPLYRVHLDFSPSMPDELRVRAGEIVRLLKEFDDGWCMCTSDDLKREGVLPRTCISNRPIRRPQNGPNNGSSPAGPMGPMGPNGQRRMSPPQNRGPPTMNNGNGRSSPAPGPGGPQYRPQQRGPGGPGPNGRPMGPPGQGRPMSPAMGPNGRNSPGPGYNGPGPQYRPQQNGRPMSPGMGPNNGPRTPQNRGQGPNSSPMGPGGPGPISSSPMQQQGQFAQQPRAMTPQGQTPRALQAGMPNGDVAQIAANFPLPGSPTTSEAPRSPRAEQVEFGNAVPEVIVTGSASPVQVGQAQTPQSVERKPVGRKPLPGQAQ